MRFIVALTALVVSYAPTAFAQPAYWVVVPTSTEQDVSWMQPTVTTMQGALSRQGINVLSAEQATAFFEQQGSASSTKVTDTDIQEWVTRSRQAIRHLARGDYATALKELKEAQVISRKAVDELNRVQNRSQNILDTCLYLVRALLETGDRVRAKAQVQECVRLVPQGDPNPHMHTPGVIALYKEASQPGPEQTGSLVVKSEPSDCEVRINGLQFGKTPFEIADLYPGEYQVQVECEPGRRGRVHPVTVRAGKTEISVDLQFDRTVRTEPLLHLRYSSKPEAQRQVSDAQQLAKVLRADTVVLASVPTVNMMELQVVSGPERRWGIVRIPIDRRVSPTPEVASGAAIALANGQCMDFTGPQPVAIDCRTKRAEAPKKPQEKEAPSGWPGDRTPRGQFITGVTLASAGTLSLLTASGLLFGRARVGDQWVDAVGTQDNKAYQDTWNNVHTGLVTTAAVGSASLTAAMPLVLPYRSKTPWWAWLSGGLGVGAAVASVVVGVTAPGEPVGIDCNEDLVGNAANARDCVQRGQSVDAAILLGTTAAPLLTMPLVYLFRKDEKSHGATLTPNLAVGPNGGWVSMEGRF